MSEPNEIEVGGYRLYVYVNGCYEPQTYYHPGAEPELELVDAEPLDDGDPEVVDIEGDCFGHGYTLTLADGHKAVVDSGDIWAALESGHDDY